MNLTKIPYNAYNFPGNLSKFWRFFRILRKFRNFSIPHGIFWRRQKFLEKYPGIFKWNLIRIFCGIEGIIFISRLLTHTSPLGPSSSQCVWVFVRGGRRCVFCQDYHRQPFQWQCTHLGTRGGRCTHVPRRLLLHAQIHYPSHAPTARFCQGLDFKWLSRFNWVQK